MNTIFTVHLVGVDRPQAQACFETVFDEIDRIEATFSRFRPSSEISRINRYAARGPIVTDPEVFQVLSAAHTLSAATGGAFDITVGRLTRVWGFAEGQRQLPPAVELVAAQESVGWHNLELDATWRTVCFTRPGMELDLGAIAKGYAVDCAAAMLRRVGVTAWIDAGSSSIAATDAGPGDGWQVSVAHPVDPSQSICEVLLGGRALSTSGVREQSFEVNGRIYSHLIDTATGNTPATTRQQVLQVTVLAPDSLLADALSTALFLLGPDRASGVMDSFPECSALWVLSQAGGIRCETCRWQQSIATTTNEGTNG